MTAQAVCTFFAVRPGTWLPDWALGLFLILLTVLINVAGFGLVGRRIFRLASCVPERDHPTLVLLMIVCVVTVLAASLHAIDAGIWAGVYRLLGAQPDSRTAMLYSLNAVTSFGHAKLHLDDPWELLGALEAMNGALLFGLSTAFLFGVIDKAWFSRREHW